MKHSTTRIWKTLPVAARRGLPIIAMLCASGVMLMVAPVERASAQQKSGGKGAPGQAKAQPQAPAKGKSTLDEVHTLKVQGNVYMITGPSGNMAVQIGDSGILIVDTQTPEASQAVIEEIRKLSTKPIRYVVDTSVDHTAGNAQMSRAGVPVVGGNLGQVAFDNGATIVAHEQVLFRMSNGKEGQKEDNADALPTNT
ncbi:MAG: hypothetical protein ABI824_18605, partial [Acidobacteriota bacterium]